MPNISSTLYVSDKDYKEKYLPHKKEILKRMRDIIREELEKIKVNNKVEKTE